MEPRGDEHETTLAAEQAQEQAQAHAAADEARAQHGHNEDTTTPTASQEPVHRPRRRHGSEGSQTRRRNLMVAEDQRRRMADRSLATEQTSESRETTAHASPPRARYHRTSRSPQHAMPRLPPASPSRSAAARHWRTSLPPGIMDRPLPRVPSDEIVPSLSALRMTSHDGAGEGQPPDDPFTTRVTLPPWQPDEEASNCPICNVQFTFWCRKHHCRKCGRVVCASCSPHRITIPRAFIVHPPSESDDSHADSDGGEMPFGLVPHLDGDSEEVRLCNPCVPDPNPIPFATALGTPPYPGQHHPFYPHGIPDPSYLATRLGSLHRGQMRALPRRRHFQGPMPLPEDRHQPLSPTNYGSAPDQRSQQLFDEMQYSRPYRPHHRPHASAGSIAYAHRHAHSNSMPFGPQLPPEHSPSPPRPARPLLREEDECPICHEALPPKGPDGSEVAREAHIAACIDSHFSSSSRRMPNRTQSEPDSILLPAPPDTETTPADGSLARENHQTTPAHDVPDIITTNHTPAPPLDPANASSSSTPTGFTRSLSQQKRRRVSAMLVYHASEKDCMSRRDDNESSAADTSNATHSQDLGPALSGSPTKATSAVSDAECVICFEEFSVGDEMGRLECLCKFHRVCIRQWWDQKGPGSCPVHQEGI